MALSALFALMVPQSAGAAEPSGPSAPVKLEIINGTKTPGLICQLVLAHFVTEDIAEISTGEGVVIALHRDLDDGTLIYRHGGGRRMAVENILCGLADNWRATRNDLNLARLRGGDSADVKYICATPEALSCKAAAGAPK